MLAAQITIAQVLNEIAHEMRNRPNVLKLFNVRYDTKDQILGIPN